MVANDIQIGGEHYKVKEYEPWDFITDNNIPYLQGNAIKYVSRWGDKNGVEDLQKSDHYITKHVEKAVRSWWRKLFPIFDRQICHVKKESRLRYLKQFSPNDQALLSMIIDNQYLVFLAMVQTRIRIYNGGIK